MIIKEGLNSSHNLSLVFLSVTNFILGMSCLLRKLKSKLESRTLSQYSLLDIVDFEDTIWAGEIIISCIRKQDTMLQNSITHDTMLEKVSALQVYRGWCILRDTTQKD